MIQKTGLMLALALMAMTSPAWAGRGELFANVFKDMDTDGDGLINEEEWHASAQKRFETLDANKDGKVSKEELESAKATFKERFKALRSGKS